MNKFRIMSVFVVLAMLFSFANVSPAVADGDTDPTAPPTAPTISTDKLDYAAGETAIISGSGFVPNESVTLQVVHTNDVPPGGNGHTPWTVITDADGRLTSSWYVDPDDSTDSTFLLTADSESGLHAEFVFADPPAATVTLNSVFTGWYDSNGNHGAWNPNYIVGPYYGGYRNFFVFDLSGVSGIVDSAEVVIPDTGCYSGSPGTYTLFDVTTPITTLKATNFGATGIHADLGSGSALGSVTFSFAPTGGFTFGLPPVMVPLNTAGVSAMNSAVGSQVALGGDYIAPAGSFILGCSGSPVNLILHLVTNQPPTADPNGPYLVGVGASIAFDGSGSFDPDGDTLTEAWTADGGTVAGNVYTAGAEAGIFDVCLTVFDGTVDSDEVCTIVVVYDPSAGFVTGGGWIDSQAGAYKDDESLSGKATFGFVSKYKKGANVPTGNTEFHFQAAGFNFHSGTYEWLVVNQGGANAQFKGEGTVNGALDSNGNAYKFMLWAGDDSTDTFRIRIWSELDGVETVVYDNGFDQELGGGSIVIHTKK